MENIECTCKGKNPQCKKCSGRGYIENTIDEKSLHKLTDLEKRPSIKKTKIRLNERLEKLSKSELEKNAENIIALIDLKSKKQMQILNSIPFSTKTFRIDFKSKFESLKMLESEKQAIRKDLESLLTVSANKQVKIVVKFNHLLSNKLVDADSNKDLKQLRREYKKMNNRP
jgi:molecular chaperone DnaK (HSP70)